MYYNVRNYRHMKRMGGSGITGDLSHPPSLLGRAAGFEDVCSGKNEKVLQRKMKGFFS